MLVENIFRIVYAIKLDYGLMMMTIARKFVMSPLNITSGWHIISALKKFFDNLAGVSFNFQILNNNYLIRFSFPDVLHNVVWCILCISFSQNR